MDDREIHSAWLKANDRISELMFRVLALQTLLQETGAFSAGLVEERIQTIRADWEASMGRRLEEQRVQEDEERVRRLLESYEGSEQ